MYQSGSRAQRMQPYNGGPFLSNSLTIILSCFLFFYLQIALHMSRPAILPLWEMLHSGPQNIFSWLDPIVTATTTIITETAESIISSLTLNGRISDSQSQQNGRNTVSPGIWGMTVIVVAMTEIANVRADRTTIGKILAMGDTSLVFLIKTTMASPSLIVDTSNV